MEERSVSGILIGALLVVLGILFLVKGALGSRPLSNPHRTPTGNRTLEPKGQKLQFLGLSRNWVGFLLIAIGLVSIAVGSLSVAEV